MKYLLLIPIILLFCIRANAQGCDSVVGLPDTVNMCSYTAYTFSVSIGGTDSVLNVAWSPNIGFNDTTLYNPTLVTPGVSNTYYATINALLPINLVVNPNFAGLNTGFTSGWTYVAPSAFALGTPGLYSFGASPYGLDGTAPIPCSLFGPNNYSGVLMSINGLGNFPQPAWQETVAVTPNTEYAFYAYVANWLYTDTLPAGAPQLQLQINTAPVTPVINFIYQPTHWHKIFGLWNSGAATTAALNIMDFNSAGVGNAFAIDSVALTPICTAVDSVYFKLSKPDTTYAVHDTAFCSNIPSILLTLQNGFSFYTWINPWVTATQNDSLYVSSTGKYVLYSYKSCAAEIDTFKVNVIPMPVPAVPHSYTFCKGDSIIVRPVEPLGTTFTWNTGSSFDSFVVKTQGNIWVVYNDSGCTIIDTIKFITHAKPIVSLGKDTASCLGQPIVLQSLIAYPPTATYQWTSGWTAFDTTVQVTGTYWLKVTDSGCVGIDTINVQIQYDTLDFRVADTVRICKGTAFTPNVAGDGGITYLWIPTTGISDPNLPAPLINTDTSAEYVLTATYGNCPIIIDSFYLSVEPTPQVYINGYRNVCEYDTIHIEVSVNPIYPNYTYSWAPTANLDNDTATTVVYYSNFGATDTTKLYIYVSTPGGCTGIDSSYIYSHPGRFLYINPDVVLCPGDSVQLLDTGAMGYHWRPGLFLSDSNSATPWVHPVTTQNYTLTAVSQFGCLDTLTMNVQVLPNAVLSVPDTVLIYPGQTYQMAPFTNCVDFQWYPPDGLTSSIISNPVANPLENTQYIVTGKTEAGCVAADTVNIIMDLNTLLAVPNAFTPGQGPNNVLYVIREGLATLNYFRIYDRWGVLVFETNNIEQGWDGTYSGAPQPFGVYVYYLQAVNNKGQQFSKQGNITLLR